MRRVFAFALSICFLSRGGGFAHGQSGDDSPSLAEFSSSSTSLPDAPYADRDDAPRQPPSETRPFLHRVVAPGLGPQDLTTAQKFEMSIRSRVSFGAFGSSLIGAGERQLENSRPHYGTDSGAFGERLGAAEIKQVSESFFSYGLYASVFHSDPHYYRLGRDHPIAHRAIYSASRVFLTRTDADRVGVNWAKLAGLATATALTNTYYPAGDRGVGPSLSAYGSSLATSVLTLELHEFVPDLIGAVWHRRGRHPAGP